MRKGKVIPLTYSILRKAMPNATNLAIADYMSPLNLTMERFDINTYKRQTCFIAQIAHESGSLHYVKELASGEAYDTGQLAISLGNTPEKDGDGQKYKGHGLIQITGLANHKALSAYFGIPLDQIVQWLMNPLGASLSAGWFWMIKELNLIADGDEFLKLSIKINGRNKKTGLPNGWEERLKLWGYAKEAFKLTIQ